MNRTARQERLNNDADRGVCSICDEAIPVGEWVRHIECGRRTRPSRAGWTEVSGHRD